MKKYVIYTVLTGAKYDSLRSLSFTVDDFDYICFVKKGEKTTPFIGCWRIIELEHELDDNARLSRYPKLAPHLTEVTKYEYSLYMDANINIKGYSIYQRFLELVNEDVHIALLKHPFRDCVYQEAYVCIAACKGGWFDIVRQILMLKRSGIQKHSGLYEANFIFRKHNSPEIKELGNLWWNTFMKYSKRDQLSLVYSLQSTGIIPKLYLGPDYTTRNHPDLEKVQHNKQQGNAQLSFKKKVVLALYSICKPLLKEDKNS